MKKRRATSTSSTGRGRSRHLRRRRARRVGPPAPDREDLYYFDAAAADLACEWIETRIVHTKGQWAGQPFILELWQREIVRALFGWERRADGLRRYTTVYVFIPRKNGKSALAAAIILYLLLCDNEPGAEIYSLAADRFQAAIVFNQAADMVRQSAELSERVKVYRRHLLVPTTG